MQEVADEIVFATVDPLKTLYAHKNEVWFVQFLKAGEYLASSSKDCTAIIWEVADLAEPTCPGLQETIKSVAHGLLAILSPKIYTKSPPHSENATGGSSLDIGKDENTSLQFQPLISVSRDYISCAPFILVHAIGSLSERFRIQARSNATAHNLKGRNGIYTSRR